MHHEGNEVYERFLDEFDLAHNFAVVNVRTFLNVHVGLQHVLEIPPHGDVLLVALGRGISGKLIIRTVMVSGGFRVSEYDEDLACKILEVHLHDEMRILFCFYYDMHGSNKMFSYYICNSCSIPLHSKCDPCYLSPLLRY